ncbi:hypothetical protein [Bifidobacterium scaligerum]|nr:hypothetical protein [Bifidobacterium scaligerum]
MTDIELLEAFSRALRRHLDSTPVRVSDDMFMSLVVMALQETHAELRKVE